MAWAEEDKLAISPSHKFLLLRLLLTDERDRCWAGRQERKAGWLMQLLLRKLMHAAALAAAVLSNKRHSGSE